MNSDFWPAFETIMAGRDKRLRDLLETEAQVTEIHDSIEREIALLLHQQMHIEAERSENARLRELACIHDCAQASDLYGEGVAKAMKRAATQGNFSALEAFTREVHKVQEEETFLVESMAIMT